MEGRGQSQPKMIHMALVTGRYEGDEEAEKLLHSLQQTGRDDVAVRLVPCRRLEEAEADLKQQKTEIIHFCGPFDEGGNFLIQNMGGQVLSGKTGNQLMDIIARLPYHVKIVSYSGYMTVPRARRTRGNTDFVIAMNEKGLYKTSQPFFTVFYSLLLQGKSLGESCKKAADGLPEEEARPHLLGRHVISPSLYSLYSHKEAVSAEKTEKRPDVQQGDAETEAAVSASPHENRGSQNHAKDHGKGTDSIMEDIHYMEKRLDIVPFLVRAVAGNEQAYQKFLRGQKEETSPVSAGLSADVQTEYHRYYEEVDPVYEWKCLAVEPLAVAFWNEQSKHHDEALSRMRNILKEGWPALYEFVRVHPSPVYFGAQKVQLLLGEEREGTQGEIDQIKKSSEGRKSVASAESLKIIGSQAESLKKKPGRIRDTITLMRNTPERFAAAWAILYAQGKQIDERSIDLYRHLKACVNERNVMADNGISFTLTPDQKRKSENLWDAVCQTFGGIPKTMEAAYCSPPGKHLVSWAFSLHWRGLPGKTLYETTCDPKNMRELMDVLALCMKDGEAVTEEKKQEAVHLFLRNLFFLSMGQVYQKMRKELQHQWTLEGKLRQKIDTLKQQAKEKKEKKKKAAPEMKELQRLRHDMVQMKQDYEKKTEQDQCTISRLRKELDNQSEKIQQIQETFECTLEEIQKGIEAEKQIPEGEQGQPAELTEEEQALLAGLRIVVLGGLPQWQTRLRQKFPNMTCIPPENLHFDKMLIKDADVVVAAIKYMGHSMGKRAMVNYLDEYGAKTVYFYGSNEDRLLRRICDALQGKQYD